MLNRLSQRLPIAVIKDEDFLFAYNTISYKEIWRPQGNTTLFRIYGQLQEC